MAQEDHIPAGTRPKHVYIPVFFVGLFMVAAVLYSLESNQRMSTELAPQIHAVLKMKTEIALAHLWFEEVIAGDNQEKISTVWTHVVNAQRYNTALIHGDTVNTHDIPPLSDRSLLAYAQRTETELAEFAALGKQRSTNAGEAAVGSKLDQQFDVVFSQVLDSATALEFSLQDRYFDNQRQINAIQYVLVGLCLFLTISVAWLLRRYEVQHRRQQEVLTTAHGELKRSEQLLETTLRSMGDAVITTDSKGLVDRMNTEAERLTGWEETQARGQQLSDVFSIVDGTSREPYDSPAEKVLQTGEVVSLADNATLIAKDGSEFHIADSGAPIRQPNGSVIGVVLVFRDISKPHQMQQELEQSHARYQQLFANMDTGLAVYRANEDGTQFFFADINAIGAKLCQVEANEVIGKDVCQAFPAVKEFGLWDVLAKVWATGAILDHPVSLYEDDRITSWFENRVFKLPSGEVVALFSDVTQREQSKAQLEQSRARLETTLSSIGDAVITTDTEGRITFMNPVAEQLTGWTTPEALGLELPKVFQIVHEDTQQPVESPIARVIREKQVVGLANHTQLVNRTGQRIPIADSGAPIVDKTGDILGVVLVFRDQTEKREQEMVLHQHQKLEAIGTLSAGVAHEINNPLHGILNYGELIKLELPPSSPLMDFAQGIVDESKRISIIVRNLLAFSRQGKETYSSAAMDEVVEATLTLIEAALRKDQIIVRNEIPANLPTILCRRQQVQQVLLNLLNNARCALNQKYPQHHPDKLLEIKAQAFLHQGQQWLRITIEDHGAGIGPDVIERIFDPFFTTKPRNQGTGLGLSVSHGIAREHGGQLLVESELGAYSRFHLEIPVERSKA